MEFRKKAIKKDQYDETIQFLEKQLKKCFEEMVGLCNQYRRYYKDLPDEILQKLLEILNKTKKVVSFAYLKVLV